MNDRQYALYQSFVRILVFTKDHATDFAPASPGGQAIATLTSTVAALRPHTDGTTGSSASAGTSASSRSSS